MSDTHHVVPAGWYDDGSGQHRWWDGQQWTSTVVTTPPPLVVPPQRRASAWGYCSVVGPWVIFVVSAIADKGLTAHGAVVLAGGVIGVLFGLAAGIVGLNQKGVSKVSSIVGIALSSLCAVFVTSLLIYFL